MSTIYSSEQHQQQAEKWAGMLKALQAMAAAFATMPTFTIEKTVTPNPKWQWWKFWEKKQTVEYTMKAVPRQLHD